MVAGTACYKLSDQKTLMADKMVKGAAEAFVFLVCICKKTFMADEVVKGNTFQSETSPNANFGNARISKVPVIRTPQPPPNPPPHHPNSGRLADLMC